VRAGFFLVILFVLQVSCFTQQTAITCPPLWGIAKMTFLVSDFQMARDYYGKFLGFDEAFSYTSAQGNIISFKVNDRQFLEFVEDKHAREKKRLVSVSFETGNTEQMRSYLKYCGLNVPDQTTIDGAGNEVFIVDDLSGNHIEFIDFRDNGLHSQSKGRFLSERRISKRIHHAGLYADTIKDEDPFYVGILKFKELFRYPEDRSLNTTIIYFGMADCTESIEHYSPNDPNIGHPCFLVEDMQETIYTLKERHYGNTIEKPIIGKGKRWILNMRNSDGTRVEFTEAYTVR
jgi:catechol 2,3-dioxygenase-like lactoylglutathione lyase family enzyme